MLAAAGWLPDPAASAQGALAMHLTISATTRSQENTQAEVLIQRAARGRHRRRAFKTIPASFLFAQDGPLYSGTYDLEWSIDTNAPDPDNSGSWTGAFIPPHGANTSLLDDPVVNATSHAAASTFESRRARALPARRRAIHELVPAVFLSWQTDYTAINDDLKNYVPAAFIGDTWNAWQWRI